MGSASSVAKKYVKEAGTITTQMISGGPPERLTKGTIVMIDQSRKMKRNVYRPDDTVDYGEGALAYGWISGVTTAATGRNNFEYTIMVEDNVTYCVEEKYLCRLSSAILPWVSPESRKVAVQVETHGSKKFAAYILHRREDMTYQVKFVADATKLDGLNGGHLSEPDEYTVESSPSLEAPDPLWLLDRKIQSNIDDTWPLNQRIAEALDSLRVVRPASQPPVSGSFVGKNMMDSEGYPSHPAPLPALKVNGYFVDTWGKYAGRIKFASTFRIGPKNPGFSDWIESVDAGDPLYFHACLPVYAGLICLGKYGGQAEWIRASDVALVGIALYVNDELQPGFAEPPVEKNSVDKYGHQSCHFIPGCASTYLADGSWVGGVFCLAPSDTDCELKDDVYAVEAYHQILKDWDKLNRQRGDGRDIILTVNLVLSTNYLANYRQVCAGQVKITMSDQGIVASRVRMRDILENRLNSKAAQNPRRPRKVLSEVTHGMFLETQKGLGATLGRTQEGFHTQGSASSLSATEVTLPAAGAAQASFLSGISVQSAASSLPSAADPTPVARTAKGGLGAAPLLPLKAQPKSGAALQPHKVSQPPSGAAVQKGPAPPPPPSHAAKGLFGDAKQH